MLKGLVFVLIAAVIAAAIAYAVGTSQGASNVKLREIDGSSAGQIVDQMRGLIDDNTR